MIPLKNIPQLPKHWRELLKDKSQMIFLVGLLAIGVCGIGLEWMANKGSEAAAIEPLASPDTMIPKGFVLVPIELSNSESLGDMIEGFAIVDLYATDRSGGKKGRRVGRHLRLLRAPLNPKTFAVLVPDEEASSVVGAAGPLLAVVQNRNLSGQGSMEKKPVVINRIEYYSRGEK